MHGLEIAGKGVTTILSRYLGGDKLTCIMGSKTVTVHPTGRIGTIGTMRRTGIVSKAIISRANRPIVKTGILIGNAAGNRVASLGKNFSVGIRRTSTALLISCINCIHRRIGTASNGVLGVMLIPSTGVVRRIIMANCNAFGGSTCTNSTTDIGGRGVTSIPSISFRSLLRKGTANMRFASTSNRPNSSTSLDVHNVNSFGTSGSPLCIVSKIPIASNSVGSVDSSNNLSTVSAIGASSVRGVAVVGSTTTTSLCNSHTTGNIILVAAGGNGANGTSVDLGTS